MTCEKVHDTYMDIITKIKKEISIIKWKIHGERNTTKKEDTFMPLFHMFVTKPWI
jgi:hypothetical protein